MGAPDAQARRRPRILLAWEFGAGRSHAAKLAAVGAHLRAAGADCLAALYEPGADTSFARLGIPVVQNVVWPARRRLQQPVEARPIRGLGDVLANLGLLSPETLAAGIAHYDGLFALFRPDVVLCENAFGALLAARGQVPAIAFGTTACLPPVLGDRLALRDDAGADTPAWPEQEVVDGLNAGLRAAGRPQLSNLAALLGEAAAVMPFGPAEFDLFAGQRTAPLLPPWLPDMTPPEPARGAGTEVFAYLHGFLQQSPQVMESLVRLPCPTRLHMPGLAPEWRARMPAHVVVEAAPVPPAEIVARARAVLHHGGQQLTALCLAAGLPQIILAKEATNLLAGKLVVGRGLGHACHVGALTRDWIPRNVDAVFADAAMGARAREAARDYAAWFGDDPTHRVADAALALARG